MMPLCRRFAGVLALLAATIVVAVPTQPAHAATWVTVDIPFVSYHSGSHITAYMRVDLPENVRQSGTCTFYFSRVTNGGSGVSLIDSYVDACNYSTDPQWGDRRESWSFQYPYGNGTYVIAARFNLDDYKGADFYEFTAVERITLLG